MSLYDVQQRADAILQKYAQYEPQAKSPAPKAGVDPFNEELAALHAAVDELMRQAADVAEEKSRTAVATKNAEIRRSKQQLLTDGIEGLTKKSRRGRGVTRAAYEERQQKIKELVDRVYSVPDGMGANRSRSFSSKMNSFGAASSGSSLTLSIGGPSGIAANPLWHKATEDTARFEQEWEASRARQDEALDRIERGVSSLADLAKAAGDELARQAPVLDEADRQTGAAARGVRSNNAKLRGVVLQVRGKRNFCIDVTLMVILLGLVAYLVTVVQKWQKH
ncbi:hypothetical protein Rsub_09182 [Raphidocelis subcapitata]|uniref:t-SNARE coiled-coil homology domain-containing protein n=1 Tax=Raphidocelis subcapitata TaxID=307507 RepID=A0A2V0PEQ1_9CHLO|nr:hypothetical protein Rsub_09182 [Raphidocelis subcapitata]|eukprot:GBF96383.1 hypothetical protein Rsub_09182 [Raphidocelis subcapitata]